MGQQLHWSIHAKNSCPALLIKHTGLGVIGRLKFKLPSKKDYVTNLGKIYEYSSMQFNGLLLKN